MQGYMDCLRDKDLTPEQKITLDMLTDSRDGQWWYLYCKDKKEWEAWRKLATSRLDVFWWFGNYGFNCVLASFHGDPDWIQVMHVCENYECHIVGHIYGPDQAPR